MSSVQEMPPAVRRYLEELEIELKKIPGVSPEEALSDAREFLVEDAAALTRSGEAPDEAEHFRHIWQGYGPPAEVAQQYASHAEPFHGRKGYAPGWRICCTKCGRSAPLADIGAVRIGAKSIHKYILAYCRGCRRLRFARIVQDLEHANLTEDLGMQTTPEQLRKDWHRPKGAFLRILLIVLITVGFCLTTTALLVQVAKGQDVSPAVIAAEKMQQAIKTDYSYRDLRKVDWDQRFETYRNQLEKNSDVQAFAKTSVEYLGAAQDVHVWLKLGDRTVGTYQPQARWNFNPRLLPKLLTNWKQHGKTVIVGSVNPSIRYVLIGTWEHREPESMATAIAAVQSAAQEHIPLIIDVRPNSGGDEIQARKVASCFVSQPTVYASHVIRKNGIDQPIQDRVLVPDPKGLLHRDGCVVLMGPANMSSCEAFLLMMRSAGIKLIGEKSMGASGNPQPHDLGNGVTLYLPSWQSMDAKHRPVEGIGIEPDVIVPPPPDAFTESDPVLAKAIELLQKD